MKKLIVGFALVFSVIPYQARIITVDDDGPADFNNIQAAIDDANDGDVIEVQPGTYTGPGNRDIDFKGKAITLRSTDPNDPSLVAATVINCQGSEADPHRGFTFHSGEGTNSIIDGFTIVNGYGPIDYIGKYPSSVGGAIFCSASSPTISNCWISGNEASGGGGICCCNGADPTIRNCTIDNNRGWGGGICCNYSNPRITNCIITNNVAPISGNLYGIGGGVWIEDGNSIIENCTIAYNWASGGGAGIYSYCGYSNFESVVSNCILWNNMPDEIAGGGSLRGVTYSDIRGGFSGTGNINADPRFANPSINDYHLKSQAGRWDPSSQSWVQDSIHSPCIDAGDPNSDWTAELWPNGKRINMGAYGGTPQASMSLSNAGNIADLDNDDSVDYTDLMLFTNKWLNKQVLLPEDLDRNRVVDFTDFAIFGQQWSGALAAEPSITYQIEDCNQEASGLFAAEQSSQTRFTATVKGNNIYFKDMMVANCCATELWLEMTVEGNLITICENEEGGFCFCICNYPVTATLGPFEPGTYILDVYEDYGGFIGTTVVTIGAAQ